MGCSLSQPEFIINEELNHLCDKIGNSCLDDSTLEAMAFSSLRVISDEVRRSFSLPLSVLKQFQFIRDFVRVSRKFAYTERLQQQFEHVEQLIRMKTWGSASEESTKSNVSKASPRKCKKASSDTVSLHDTPCSAKNNSPSSLAIRSGSETSRSCSISEKSRHSHHQKTMVFTAEELSVCHLSPKIPSRPENVLEVDPSRSLTYTFYDLEMGMTVNNFAVCSDNSGNSPPPTAAKMIAHEISCTSETRRRELGGSIDSQVTTEPSFSRLKSIYICPTNSCSQETLGDFGFFDEEEFQI